jgi:uncharacterized protein YqgV (UPF0045/DUF77 family)
MFDLDGFKFHMLLGAVERSRDEYRKDLALTIEHLGAEDALEGLREWDELYASVQAAHKAVFASGGLRLVLPAEGSERPLL